MAKTDLCTAIEAEMDTNTTGRSLRVATSYWDIGTATATNPTTTSGAATVSKPAGIVTTNVDVNSGAATGTYTLTLTNTHIAASSLVNVQVRYGTCTTGYPIVQAVTPGSGSCVIVIRNAHPSAAFNGSLIIDFIVCKSLVELA